MRSLGLTSGTAAGKGRYVTFFIGGVWVCWGFGGEGH